jgi:hypothetical protein
MAFSLFKPSHARLRRLSMSEITALPEGLMAALSGHVIVLIDAPHPLSWVWQRLGLGRLILVRGRRIYWPDLPRDLSLDPYHLSVLAHELTHVWQYQTGMTLLSYLGRERGQYRYRPEADKGFTAYGYEQQAAMVEDWVRLGLGLEPRWGEGVSLAWLRSVIPFA